MTAATSREIVGTVLRALAERGQAKTAEAARVSETRLSRWKSTSAEGGGLDLEEVAAVLAELGLAVIPANPEEGGLVCMPTASYRALHVLLRDYSEAVANGRTQPQK